MFLHTVLRCTHLSYCRTGAGGHRQVAAKLQALLQNQGAVLCLGLLDHGRGQPRLQLLHLASQLRELGLLALAEPLLCLPAAPHTEVSQTCGAALAGTQTLA